MDSNAVPLAESFPTNPRARLATSVYVKVLSWGPETYLFKHAVGKRFPQRCQEGICRVFSRLARVLAPV